MQLTSTSDNRLKFERVSFERDLVAWYRKNKRPLPWRESKDPYSVLISEIMLQQTTVAVVIPYYEKFLKEFPTVKALALAPEEKVMSLWSGLGYYSRARNLHAAAKSIHQLGEFPRTYTELLNLKGVGPYTAAAVASIAFEESVAAIDGNVIRVVSRIFDISEDVQSKIGKEKMSDAARKLMGSEPPSEHNQSMMELGATICLPRKPACLICPVLKHCESNFRGTVDVRPMKMKKQKQDAWLWNIYVMKRGNRVALVKSSNGTPWLKNTWVMPGDAKPWNEKNPPPFDFRHSITHHKIFVKIKKPHVNFETTFRQKTSKNIAEVKWADLRSGDLGVSSIVHKVFDFLKSKPTLFLAVLFFAFSTGELKYGPLFSSVAFGTESTTKNPTPNQSPPATSAASATSATPVTVPRDFVQPKATQLTFEGENTQPTYAPNRLKLMFQSIGRPSHKNSQIYLLDLKSSRERRLTYNDGEDTSAAFSPSGKTIIYSSTTDELKERPEKEDSKAQYLNYEIYEADADGSHRVRLTDSPGYDADGVYSPDGKTILFCSRRDGYTELFTMNDKSRKPRHLVAEGADTKAVPFREGGKFSPNGKNIVWSESSSKGGLSQMMVSDANGKHIKKLSTRNANHVNPSWSPDGNSIIFSSNRDDALNYEIYMISLDGKCLKRLTFTPEKESFPSFSPDGKKIVFVSNKNAHNQIYEMNFEEPKTCSEEK